LSQAVNSASMKLEGIVSKRIESSYRSGKSKNWIKEKCAQWKDVNAWRHEFFEKRC
jgi:ATP-dependent DNA ligase